ncbi:MAG: crosslink repair DNA glycosylase YcaQ family protein [Pseudolysinimonas sp.]|uniref:DNA glycosylase AlkZ-like family protein n=1 Tax=Pseudolysinimonas sp. TaxID=2680009 RepID=UPI003264E383
MTHHLTRDEARRLAVRAQRLDAERAGDVVEIAEDLGAIKIDPTTAIAPAEHTILWSRLGRGYEPAQLSKAVERDRLLFEFDGSFRPISRLAPMQTSMRAWPRRASTKEWLEANAKFRADVLARLKAEGPLFASEIPDIAEVSRPPDGWSGSNQTGIMLEFLARQGVVAIAGREGRHRRWDLAERIYPQNLPVYETAEAEQLLNEARLRSYGIAKQNSPWIPVGTAGEPATVEGSDWKWRVDPEAVAALDDDPGGRVAFLSPYDGMLFHRAAIKELFDFEYVLEQFKPKAQRIYGYFAHPILFGDRFIGQLDAEVDRKREVLKVNAVHEMLPFDPEEHEIVRLEIEDLAEWLGLRLEAW